VLTTLAVENYRSLRQLVLPLRKLTVVTGGNGTGKSSLYRALRLLANAARGGAVAALAREGGLPSTLWAGPEKIGKAVRDGTHPVQGTVRTGPVSLKLGFAGDDFAYAMDLGLPQRSKSAFALDPEIKSESVWSGPLLRPAAVLVERRGPTVRLRERGGGWQVVPQVLKPYESMLSEFVDPERAPELLTLRECIRSWRFYDHVRTDADAPARRSHIGTRTPVLGHDGADLAAALQTIREIGDHAALDEAIDHAFPGSSVEVVAHEGRFEIAFQQHGLLRPLSTAELSDGTLRYLLWTAALLSPRPPDTLILNEPETSLHPQLLAPLAGLIAAASTRTQVIAVTHARPLVSALERADPELHTIELVKQFGETRVDGQEPLDQPAWIWPKR
jgi:predicted ATPase